MRYMRNKLFINGEEANKGYNLRTTPYILQTLHSEAIKKNTSINVIMNQALLQKAKQIDKKNKLQQP